MSLDTKTKRSTRAVAAAANRCSVIVTLRRKNGSIRKRGRPGVWNCTPAQWTTAVTPSSAVPTARGSSRSRRRPAGAEAGPGRRSTPRTARPRSANWRTTSRPRNPAAPVTKINDRAPRWMAAGRGARAIPTRRGRRPSRL